MPVELAEALNKKGGLTLTQLANYDDICTDALVDRVYFWSLIRKVRPNARPVRGVREGEICKILQEHVIIDKDPIAAQRAIMALAGMRSYINSLKTEDEKEHFERHMRKYVNIWQPDCPFEVCTTHRYTITTAEASVVARKPIRAGEAIKYLAGIQVELSEEEEKGLSSRTDFSIVLSSRRKRPSLFLGPARFANHDCDSNARLTTTGPHGISIVACKNINVGDEITVRYGENYFGEANCECLCGTCEQHLRNGWDPRGPLIRDSSSDEDEDEEESKAEDEEERRPRKRQRTAGLFEAARSIPVTTTSASSGKRKDASFSLTLTDPGFPVKRGRGRPRKHPLSGTPDQAKSRDILTRMVQNTSKDKRYNRDFLKAWFEVRAKQNDVDGDVDVVRVKEEIKGHRKRNDDPEESAYFGQLGQFFGGLTDSTNLESNSMDAALMVFCNGLSKNSVLNVKSVLPTLGVLFKGLTEGTETDIRHTEAMLAQLVQSSARKLNISVDEVRNYWTDGSNGSQVALPARPRKSSRIATAAAQQSQQSLAIGDELPQRESGAKGALRSNRILTTKQRQHAGSPLRKMVSIEQADEVEEPDAASDNKSRNTSSSSKSRTSTSDTARSSVFSDAHAEPASPPSSHEDNNFAPGNICQNIVDMYTNGMDRDEQPAEDTVASEHDEEDEDAEDHRGEPRTPGDYHLCQALLIETNDRWVECRNCDEYFVQHDAYQTRIACPRCERHSKLYGYYWPKTDRTGVNDREERILDHRLIHRFIDPEEEREERKGRRSLAEVVREREMSTSQDSDSLSHKDNRDDSRRRSRRLA